MPPKSRGQKKEAEESAPAQGLTAYCPKLRRKVEMDQIELVTMKNGRPAAKGVAKEDPTLAVFRILSKAEAEELAKTLG